MSKILVTGPYGYIGHHVCLALIRNGYFVYGLCPKDEKQTDLLRSEIIPVPGSIKDSDHYSDLILHAHIDVVVDTASSTESDSTALLAQLKKVGAQQIKNAQDLGRRPAKLGFVHLSCAMVHGSSPGVVNDLDPVGVPQAPAQPAEVMAWRPDFEQQILASSDVLDVIILRPTLVYGGAAPLWSDFLLPIFSALCNRSPAVEFPCGGDTIIGLVHVSDVAEAVRLAIDKLQLLVKADVHPIFDLVSSHESAALILTGCARALGCGDKKLNFNRPDDPGTLAQALNTSTNTDSTRAMNLLGWQPKRVGMARATPSYARAWSAWASPAISKDLEAQAAQEAQADR